MGTKGSTVLGVKWTLDDPEVMWASGGTSAGGDSGGGTEVDPRPN